MSCMTCARWKRRGKILGKCSFVGAETTSWTRCNEYAERLSDPNADRFRLVRDPQGFVHAVLDEV